MAIESYKVTEILYNHFKEIVKDILEQHIPDLDNQIEMLFDTNLKGEIENPKTYRLFCQRGIIAEGKETLSIDVSDNGFERYYSKGYAVISIYAPKHLTKSSGYGELLGFHIKKELRRRDLGCITVQNVKLERLNDEINCYRFDIYMQVLHSEIY